MLTVFIQVTFHTMAMSVLSTVMSQATGGGVFYAISLLLGYMPERTITQHLGMHHTQHAHPCVICTFSENRKLNGTA